MKEKIQNKLANSYAPAVHSRLSRFPSRDQLPIAAWLVQTPIGTNFALQILEHLQDLSKKSEMAPSSLLTQILSQLEIDERHPKEIGRQVRGALVRELNPKSSDHQRRFLEWRDGLELPCKVELESPLNFEGTVYTLKILFEGVEELSERLEETKKCLDNPAWEHLKEF